METGLLYLIFHIAAALSPQVAQHLGEDCLQIDFACTGAFIVVFGKAVVGYIERCTIAMHRAL